MQKFENSFLKQIKYWFLGASDQTPIHNNAMEGFNSSINVLQTHWERKPIAEFKLRLLEMVAERSTAYVMDKDSFEHTVPVTREMQIKGYENNFISSKPKIFLSVMRSLMEMNALKSMMKTSMDI